MRLIGDDRQLAAVGAGGVLRDIDRTHGAVTLSEVRRFTHADGSANRAEAAASLAIRRGEPAGLGYYLDHGRIHVGDDTTTADQAFAAWSADRAAGLDSLLIASTNEQVRELNLRAQAARLAAAAVPAKRRVTLADGTTVSDGDAIITRRNDRRLTLSATDWVANGDRWTVTSVRPDGALEVRHAQSRRRVTLPAGYVAQHVQLGYACTVHAAQGQTVDTSHTVVTGTESRQLLYVALTRGRRANNLYLDVSVSGDDDVVVYAEAQRPATDRGRDADPRGGARRLRRICHQHPPRGTRPRPAAAQGVCRIRSTRSASPPNRSSDPTGLGSDRGSRRRHRPRHHRLPGMAGAQRAAPAARHRRSRCGPGAA